MMKKITKILLVLITIFVCSDTSTSLAGENELRKLNSSNYEDPYSIPSLKSIKGDGGGFLIGFRIMPTVTNLDFNDNDDGTVTATSKIGFGIGGLLGFNFNEHVGIQVEAIYSSISQQYSQAGYVADVKLRYINFPMMLVLNTDFSKIINLNLAAGPQIGLNVGSSLDVREGGDSVNALLAVKKSDLGFAYGAGLDFGLEGMKLSVGFRGVFGLVNINDDSKNLQNDEYYILQKTNLNTYSVYIGLTFGGSDD